MSHHCQSLLILVVSAALASVAQVYYVAPDGSDSADGSVTAPLATVLCAYQRACTNGGKALVLLAPGTYAQGSPLTLANADVLIKGSGPDQSLLDMDVLVADDCALADLCIEGTLLNEAWLMVHNVKLLNGPLAAGTGTIAGTWLDAGDAVHVQNLREPSASLDAVNKIYVDASTGALYALCVSNYLSRTGGTLSGALTLPGAPTSANHAATKAYVDGAVTGGLTTATFVKKSGDTMTGRLTVNANDEFPIRTTYDGHLPIFEVWNGGYQAEGAQMILHGYDGAQVRIGTSMGVPWIGTDYPQIDPWSTNLRGNVFTAAPTQPHHIAVKATVDNAVQQLTEATVAKSGGSMTGPLILSGPPSAPLHAATMAYVDDSFKGFDYDARYVYIDKYYDGRNGYLGSLRAPYTNFFHALAAMGSNSFYGYSTPVVYHLGHGFYAYPTYDDPGYPYVCLRIGIVGRGAFYRNIHSSLSGDSTAFSEIGTFVDKIHHAWPEGCNTNNAILYLKDIVVSGVYLKSSAHDEVYCDNVVFLSVTNNGQQRYHGMYYTGVFNGSDSYQALLADSIRPGYWAAAAASNDAAYVRKAGDTICGSLVVNGALSAGTLAVSNNWVVGSGGGAQLISILNNAAGSVTWSSGASRTVTHNLNISGNYVVIITPTSTTTGPSYVSAKTSNSFTVNCSMPFNFDYVIIGK